MSRETSWSLSPLDSFPAAAEALTAERIRRLVWMLLVLGVVVRTIRYLLQFPLWPDESYLAQNFLDRNYRGLTQPLDFIQIAPIGYLWLQHTLLKLVGFSELTLRLYVFVCSIGSLFLFRHLAGRLLSGTAYLLAFGTFAVAYPLIRYAAEAKPYGADMFVAIGLLCLTVEWCLAFTASNKEGDSPLSVERQSGQSPTGRWLAITLALPLSLVLSYPAVFVAGGIVLTMATVLWRRGSMRDWLLLGVTCAAITAGVAGVFFGSARAQMAGSGPAQQVAFAPAFPPLDSVKKFALFLVTSNTSESMAYPIGGDHGASTLTTLCCLVGLAMLLRRRRWSLVMLCTAPLALSFVAACLRRYPYGNHSRFALFMAPVFCLLTGLGAAALLSLAKNRRWSPAGPVRAAVGVLVLIAVASSVRDFFKPYKEPCWGRNRDFARWFWTDKAQDAELVCYRFDMAGRQTADKTSDLASIYYCNQRIYCSRLAHGQPAQLDRVAASHPLRVARFHPSAGSADDEAEFHRWLSTQETKYRLIGRESFPVTFWVKRELKCVDQVELYEFVPRAAN